MRGDRPLPGTAASDELLLGRTLQGRSPENSLSHDLLTEVENLFAQEPELLWELLQEEWEQLLVVGLVHVVLPLGHVPSSGVGWHYIVWMHLQETCMMVVQYKRTEDHLEQLLLERGQQLAGDAMEGCGGGDELDLVKAKFTSDSIVYFVREHNTESVFFTNKHVGEDLLNTQYLCQKSVKKWQ